MSDRCQRLLSPASRLDGQMGPLIAANQTAGTVDTADVVFIHTGNWLCAECIPTFFSVVYMWENIKRQ